MTFVTLDSKDWCKGIYHRGQLHFDNLPQTLAKTWRYASYLNDMDIEYIGLYAQGASISELCPEEQKQEWEKYKKKLKAYHNSFVEAKIDLDQNCFFDLVPKQFLLEVCEQKVKIIDHVFETHQKPQNYSLLLEVDKILNEISGRKLNLDFSILQNNLQDQRAITMFKMLKKSTDNVSYNLFGSKTGRLTTNPGTFPILNLDSKYRSIIKPTNDAFVELDFNAAEVRTLLALTGEEQPKGDIHEWNAKRLGLTREEAKKEIFAWLYGSKKIDSKKYESIFGLDKLLDQFYDGYIITNLYKRKLKSDQYHSINYLIQSTTSDLVLDQITKINKLLKNSSSFISFLVHDSVVIDLKKEDKSLVNDLIKMFSHTKLGNFPVNISIGKDYGTLRKI